MIRILLSYVILKAAGVTPTQAGDFPLRCHLTLPMESWWCKRLGELLLPSETYDSFNSHTLLITLIILQNIPLLAWKKNLRSQSVYSFSSRDLTKISPGSCFTA